MKLSYKIALAAVTFTLTAGSVFSQVETLFEDRFESYNFEFTGSGARAMGMGNAFLGVADDVYAINWNPAGLYKLESTILGLSYTKLSPKGEFQSERVSFNTPNPIRERLSFDRGGSFGALTQATFVAPLRIKGHPFVGSISYARNSSEFNEQGYKIDLIEVVPIFNEAGTFLFTDTIFETIDINSQLAGGIDAINVGFGTRIRENMAFGLSANIYSGKSQRNSVVFISGDNLPVNNFQHGTFTSDRQVSDSNKYSGFNVTVGLKLDGKILDAGLVVRTPFSLSQKRQRVLSQLDNVNGGPFFTDTIFQIDLLTKYDIPLMVGLGVGYHYKENWLFAADLEYRSFSSAKIKIRENLILVPGGNNIEEFDVLDASQWQYSNVFIVRAGTEFLKETSVGTIPLRAGIGYVPLPAPNTDINGSRSTSVSYQFSLGTGIHWNQIKLDLGYMYKTYNLKSRFFSAEEKSQNHFLNASFTGYF